MVRSRPTRDFHVMRREDIDALVQMEAFGRLLSADSQRALLFDITAGFAKSRCKSSDVMSFSWTLEDSGWLLLPVQLHSLTSTAPLEISQDVYEYSGLQPGTMVVDFASRCVGGGCFSRGFVQEEQMVVQSADLAARLYVHRPTLHDNEVISFEGVHFDAWWDKSAAGCKGAMNPYASQARPSPPSHCTCG